MTVVPVFQIHCVRDYIKECDIINIPWIASVCVFFFLATELYIKKVDPPSDSVQVSQTLMDPSQYDMSDSVRSLQSRWYI